VFRSGTRLVEVDVVVRDRNGPVRGLTKDDFTLYDCKASERSITYRIVPDSEGPYTPCKVKRQPIEMFREINAAVLQGTAQPTPLRPGAVSNRAYSDGKPVTSATIVLVDQLNTAFNLKGYLRVEMAQFLKSIDDRNRIALYSLGGRLHLLQDFTDDPKKLIEAVSKLDSGDGLKVESMEGDPAGMTQAANQITADMKSDTVIEAVQKIIQHMAGVPGRKNLVWIAQSFGFFDPAFKPPVLRNLLGAANIAVYPVMVRGLQVADVTGARFRPQRAMPDLDRQAAQRQLGETLGGTAFNDADDALEAVHTAEEDSSNYYVLGFYPSEQDLDGSTHQLTLETSKRVTARHDLAVQYRRVYLASKPESVTPPTLADIFASPLNATTIGLAANIVQDPGKPQGRQIQVTVNLADLQLRHENGRAIGSFQMVVRFEKNDAGVLTATDAIAQTVPINFAAEQMQDYGLVTLAIPPGLKPSTAHIVVQDGSNGAAGSLRLPINN